jgi:hypothetical protein
MAPAQPRLRLLGELELRRGQREIAMRHFRAALSLARNPMEHQFFNQRILACVSESVSDLSAFERKCGRHSSRGLLPSSAIACVRGAIEQPSGSRPDDANVLRKFRNNLRDFGVEIRRRPEGYVTIVVTAAKSKRPDSCKSLI